MNSPHVSPEPPNFLSEDISNLPEKSPSLKPGWTEKVGHFIYHKKKPSPFTEENLEELTSNVEAKRYYSSPYYKGLLNTEKVLGTTPEAEILQNFNLNAPKPPTPGPISPDRESQATTYASSSSRSSFSVKMQEWSASCFSFKIKDEKVPTMIKVYSTEPLNEESLRERGSESPSSPLLAPPSPPVAAPVPPISLPPLPPSPTNRVVINAKDTSEPKPEKKYFWADRYRPEVLKDFICNKDKANELQKTVNEDDCHHFIFEGQAGVGKRTMIWALLRDAFGTDKVQGFEKHVIVELIKETNKLTNKMARCGNDNCRAIILHEADKLSTDALLYIRWVIERYRGCHKIFFCCQDSLKLQPLKTVCKLVQLLSPSNKEVIIGYFLNFVRASSNYLLTTISIIQSFFFVSTFQIIEVLEFIAKKEEIELPKQLAERIAINSKNNLRQAIRSFEATWQYSSPLEEDQVILTGWEDDIADIAESIVVKQSPKQLYDIRRKLQNLIDHSVPPEFIFKTLAVELKKNVEELMHNQIDKMYKEYS
ncbi:DNA polymerase III, clamp loader complex, gamma/delta/delta subunit, C-terminal, partial [Cynara cardunculus var. scolymus]